MVKALYSHFEIIRKTCFEDRAKENYLGLGTEELIAYSNKELKDLEKELRLFNVQKDDLRFDLYKMIQDMLLDNLALRLWVNDLMQHQIYSVQKKLDRHAHNQVVREVEPYPQRDPQDRDRRP